MVGKATLTIERKLATEAERMYLGFTLQQSPVTMDYVDVKWALETDYTPNAKIDLYDLFLAGTAPPSVLVKAVGGAIGSSGYNNTIQFQTPSTYVDSGGEPSPDGPKIVSSTINLAAKIDTAGDSFLNCLYYTPDTSA